MPLLVCFVLFIERLFLGFGHGAPLFTNKLADFTYGHHYTSVLGANLCAKLQVEEEEGGNHFLGLQEGFRFFFIPSRLQFLHLGQELVLGISRLRAIVHHEEALRLKLFGLPLESSFIISGQLFKRFLFLVGNRAPLGASEFHSLCPAYGCIIRYHTPDVLAVEVEVGSFRFLRINLWGDCHCRFT